MSERTPEGHLAMKKAGQQWWQESFSGDSPTSMEVAHSAFVAGADWQREQDAKAPSIGQQRAVPSSAAKIQAEQRQAEAAREEKEETRAREAAEPAAEQPPNNSK